MSLPRDTTPDPAEARRRREQDPLLSSVVRAVEAAHDRDCPDAEWLALYADQALTAADVRVVAPHLHACERCQAIVAAYQRASADAPADADLRAIPAAAGAGGLGGWLAGWRWLVPATSLVAVMVVAVWIGREPADEVAESARQVAGPESARQGRATEAASPAEQAPDNFVAPPSPAAPGTDPSPADARQRARGLARPAAPAAAVGGVAGNTAPAQASRADAPVTEAAPETRTKALAPPPGVRQEAAVAERETPEASRDAAAGRPAPAPSAAGAAAAATSARQQEPVLGANDFAITSEPLPARWRARTGAVERSRDNGSTWQRVATPVGVSVVAVASPGPAVCWAIGEHAVMRATDGATFTHEPVPSGERLTAITASDAMNAVVTTASGARFVTANGGRTWRSAP